MSTVKSIFDAVSQADVDTLRANLSSDSSLANVKQDNETPLHRAATKGDMTIAKLLLDFGADVDGLSEGWEWRPIVHAAWRNDFDMVKLLIEHGADVTQTGGQPIHYAGQRRHKEICRILVEAGAIDDLVQSPDPDVLAVFRAAYSYDASTLTKLLTTSPQLANARDVEGRTPMHEAGTNGAVEVIRVLIEMGADVNAEDNDGETPIQRASSHQHGDVCQLLASEGARVDIFTASALGWKDHVAEILKHDPSLAQANRGSYLLIETVCEAGYIEIGRMLAESGATVDISTACSLGLKDQVEALLKETPSLVKTKRKMFDYEPLHCAAECGHPEIVEMLLDAGADVNGHNGWKFTPLHLAVIGAREGWVTENHLKICRMLIQHGTDVKAIDDYDRSPLDLARGNIRYGKEHGQDESQLALYQQVVELLS
jgi:ankyrin repeat protein